MATKQHNDEATQYRDVDNEATQYRDSASTQNEKKESADSPKNSEVKEKPSKSNWGGIAAGAGSGLLVGTLATTLMGMKPVPHPNNGENEQANHSDEQSQPEWVDNQVQVATTVTDDMSFGEAFAAARAEIGSGGVFEWHGQIYSTYTAEEWNSMSPEERAEFSEHFNWSHIDSSSSDVAQNSDTPSENPVGGEDPTGNDDDIEIVSVDPEKPVNEPSQAEPVEVNIDEPEVEILGVIHDSETNTNIGGVTIDGQDVILVDIDNNGTFDYMAIDANNDNHIDSDEIVDIQGQNITVAELGGISNPLSNPATDDFTASNGLDYSSDDVYEG